MAENGAEQAKNVWPLPKFSFQVKWSDKEIQFQEVSGLDVQAEASQFCSASRSAIVPKQGMIRAGNATMKKGLTKGDTNFWKWLEMIKMNTIERQTVFISLLNEIGAPTMVWELTNAWPIKIAGPDLKTDGEVAIDMIEIAYEGVMIIKS